MKKKTKAEIQAVKVLLRDIYKDREGAHIAIDDGDVIYNIYKVDMEELITAHNASAAQRKEKEDFLEISLSKAGQDAVSLDKPDKPGWDSRTRYKYFGSRQDIEDECIDLSQIVSETINLDEV